MNSSIDLNLLLLARQGANLTSELPDLYAVTPPHRTARGRESDSLIIYMSMSGNSPLLPESHAQLLEQLAHKFYKTSGSLTAALRTIVEALNLYLLDRNLRSTSMGRQGIGQLLLVALRADTLYMAQCGLVHVFLVTQNETQHIYDPQSSGRGLGFSRTTPIRFLQAKPIAGDYLVLSTSASPNWSETTLQNPQGQGVEALRNQLLENTTQDFNTVIIQVLSGTGKLRLLRRKAEPVEAAQPIISEQPAIPASPITPTPLVEMTESTSENNQLEITTGEVVSDELTVIPEADKQDESLPSEITPFEIPAEPEEEKLEAPPDEMAAVEVTHELVGEEKPMVAPVSIPEIEPEDDAGVDKELVRQTSPTLPISPEPTAEAPLEEETPTSTPSSSEAIPETTIAPVTDVSYPSIASKEPSMEADNVPETVSREASLTVHPRKDRHPSKPSPLPKYLASARSTLAPIATAIGRAFGSAFGTIGASLLRLLKNLLPDADVLRLPPSIMVFIAIAIPVILAIVGGTVFLQRGRAQQYQIYYAQAVEQAANAESLTDPSEQRLALQTTIADLDKAEFYTVTSQSQELRAKMVAQLDILEAVKRLDYKQAIVGGLDNGVSVTRMVVTTTDLYMLNGKEGNVIHAIMTGRGYEIDPNFQCGPTYGPINVGPLVDIAELPPGSFENASVLGMDTNGNLLYCVVGSQPYSASMAPPNTGFGEPIAMSLDRGDLYLLDPKVNAVWIYRNMEVSQQPHFFFGDTIPPMQDVIDMVVYNDDLYLLHADGHTTKCTYSAMAESPTRCDDPYPYSDNRPGRAHGPFLADAVFNQIYFSSFPERSIFMLDPQNQSVYYFSVLLTLQWQYQSKNPLAVGKATAFAISTNRMAYLAIGNNIYYAAMP